MRIIMVATEYPPAQGYGLARYGSELAIALVAAGHETHVVTGNYDGGRPGRIHNGVHVHDRRRLIPVTHYDWVGDAVLHNMHLLERAMEVTDEFGPFDAIISHDWLAAQAAKSLRSVLGVPWTLVMHDTELGKRGNRLTASQAYIAEMEGWAMQHADRIVCCSQFMKKELGTRYQCPADKVHVVPCGVNAASFEVETAFREFRRLFAPDDVRLVLFVGRLSPTKGPDLLLDAVPSILRARRDVHFIFCGGGVMADALKERTAELGVQDAVSFPGYLGGKVLAAVYRVADALVVPSRYEPFGMVALEGATCGLPVITSGAGGLAEIAKRTSSVRTLPENTPEAIAVACLSALPETPVAVPRSIVRPDERYEWTNVAGRGLDVLRSAVSKKKASVAVA